VAVKRSFLIKIHLYCGLFTIFYLIAFGFSSLILNHDLKLDNESITRSWEAPVAVAIDLPDDELAESIKDQLGLMGWTPYWKFNRDEANFEFTVTHPGRNYLLNLDLTAGQVQVNEAPKGFLAVLHNLHFLNGNIPNAPLLIRSWAVYQWFTLLTMLISLILGIWLWLKYSYQPWEGMAFGGLLVVTLIVMMMI
jgi:hypothetical protein